MGEARNGRNREHEDERQTGEKDVERDFVRRLLPLRPFDERNHAVEEGRSRRSRNADLDPVGKNAGAAGHGRAIAATLADHGRGLAGDRRFVDRGDAIDNIPIARDEVAGLDEERDRPASGPTPGPARCESPSGDETFRDRVGARLAQCRRLRLAAAFGHGFREIREKQCDPEPQPDLKGEPQRPRLPRSRGRGDIGSSSARSQPRRRT